MINLERICRERESQSVIDVMTVRLWGNFPESILKVSLPEKNKKGGLILCSKYVSPQITILN